MGNKKMAWYGRRSLRRLGILVVVTVCFLLTSCTSKAVKRQRATDKVFDSGDYVGMIAGIRKNPGLYGSNNQFLLNMDIGVLFHYAGMYDSSNVYMLRAYNVYDQLFTRSVTNEAAALLTNDNARPYRAKPYELIMMHQITALNFMALGRFDDALVETRKAQIHFNEWERTVASAGKYHTDGMFHLFSSTAFEGVGEIDNSMISLFKSVAAYQRGPVELPAEVEGFAHARLTADNREEDVQRLGISPNDAPNGWNAAFGDAEIIIVSHTGRGPSMRENNWYGTYIQSGRLQNHTSAQSGGRRTFEIPAPPLPSGTRDANESVAVKISLPELVTHHARTSYLTAQLHGSSETVESVVVNDLELQAQKAMDDAWANIVSRTIVRAVIRTLAANDAKNRINTGNSQSSDALRRLTDIATDQMERADIRMCFLLPQRVHKMRIPVSPGTHSVTVNVHDRAGNVIGKRTFDNIAVGRGEKKVLFHNSFR